MIEDHTAKGNHIPRCYLPPSSSDFTVFTPSEGGTRFSDPRGMQGWVDLGDCIQWQNSVIVVLTVRIWTDLKEPELDCWYIDSMFNTDSRLYGSVVTWHWRSLGWPMLNDLWMTDRTYFLLVKFNIYFCCFCFNKCYKNDSSAHSRRVMMITIVGSFTMCCNLCKHVSCKVIQRQSY